METAYVSRPFGVEDCGFSGVSAGFRRAPIPARGMPAGRCVPAADGRWGGLPHAEGIVVVSVRGKSEVARKSDRVREELARVTLRFG